MEIIKKLSERISEEIDDACFYAKWALELKLDNRRLADVFYNLSLDEMKHSETLHNEVVDIISNYRKEVGEPPEGMMAVYNYLHEKQIDAAQRVRGYQAMYKDR